MDPIKDGTKYRCRNGCWRGTDHEVPNDCWVTEDSYDSYYWLPVCPVCREDLWDIEIYGEE